MLLSAAIAGTAWNAVRAHAQIAVRNQGYVPFSEPPINYRSGNLNDPVAKLQVRLNDGTAKLTYEPRFGYLRSVLKQLDVPVTSQTLVFSKTSFQYKKISPDHPRALYFNDEVYVGRVHEGKAIEIVSFDPLQGAIFYLLDERKSDHPVFQRAELDCTQCHIAAGTRGVPGVLLRSIYPTETGTQSSNTRSYITDQDSPLEQRWGGWYVTGLLKQKEHLGNAVVREAKAEASLRGDEKALETLSQRSFDPALYLSAQSDVVAHLVLAHQTQMHNLITLTNYRTRIAIDSAAKRDGVSDSALIKLTETDREQFERPAEQLLRYLLFTKEAALQSDGARLIDPRSPFARQFAQQGPRDTHGRSLRDFDLSHRIFRYPCSYLVYSQAFDQIPEPAKGYIYHRLFEVLTGRDTSSDFAVLSEQDRSNVLEILLATKSGLPEEWKTYAKSNHLRVHLAQSHPARSRQG